MNAWAEILNQMLSQEGSSRSGIKLDSALTVVILASYIHHKMLLQGNCLWTVVAIDNLPLWVGTGDREGRFQEAITLGKSPKLWGM